MQSIFEIDFGLTSDYKTWVADLMKYVTVQITVHLLGLYIAGTLSEDLFNAGWLQNIVLALIGFTMYHLVVNKAVTIKYN